MAKTVLILGGSHAGLHVAHYILKQKIDDVKVILVSKNSHYYWNLASVRAIVPGQFKDDQLFAPLITALERYPAESWELLIASADKIDTAAKTVAVKVNGPASIERSIPYDQLVIATGAQCVTTDVPWKHLETYEDTIKMLHETAAMVGAAKHIIVAGAGTTGLEVAGELGFEYGSAKPKEAQKEIWMVSSGPNLLSGDSVGPRAVNELTKLGVKIKYDAKVVGSKKIEGGKTEVMLENGETMTTDLYLPTQGMRANSEMVESKYLDENKLVVVDEMYHVKGAPEGVWALGDVVSAARAAWINTQKQAAGVGVNVVSALKEKAPTKVKLLPVDALMASVGRSRGVGRVGFVPAPSIAVWAAKGRTLGAQHLAEYVDGSVA